MEIDDIENISPNDKSNFPIKKKQGLIKKSITQKDGKVLKLFNLKKTEYV